MPANTNLASVCVSSAKPETFDRGETVEVAAVVENGLRVRRPDGTEVDFIPASAAASFDVGEARELKVAAGDWLLLQANHGREFINGERVQVREIQNGRIALADGRVLPALSTRSRTATPSRRIRHKAKPWMKCCWSRRHAPSPPSTANNFMFPFLVAASVSTFSPMTPNCSPAASPIRMNARLPSNSKPCAMTWPNSASSARNVPAHGTSRWPATADFRATRPVRPSRPTRFTRLPPVQQLTQMVEEVNRWLGERFAVEPKQTATEKIKPAKPSREPKKSCKPRPSSQREKIEQADSAKADKLVKPRITPKNSGKSWPTTQFGPGHHPIWRHRPFSFAWYRCLTFIP